MLTSSVVVWGREFQTRDPKTSKNVLGERSAHTCWTEQVVTAGSKLCRGSGDGVMSRVCGMEEILKVTGILDS